MGKLVNGSFIILCIYSASKKLKITAYVYKYAYLNLGWVKTDIRLMMKKDIKGIIGNKDK